MFCSNCGKNITGGNVCPYCGTYMQKSADAPKKEKQKNGMAVAGFVLSFFSPLLGWIFGGIGLSRSKERGGAGKSLATAAIAIASIGFALNVLMLMLM